MNKMDIRRLAYQVALKNNVKNLFEGYPGKRWLAGFLKRNHQILSIPQPTGSSQARAKGFTKETMHEFYDNLEKIQADKTFPAARI